MVEEERYCIDVLTQIGAIEAALDKVALGLIDDHTRHCVVEAEGGERVEKVDELMAALGRFVTPVSDVLDTIWEGLEQSLLMAYEVWWALVLGFAISAIVQAWVPRERIEAALSGRGLRPDRARRPGSAPPPPPAPTRRSRSPSRSSRRAPRRSPRSPSSSPRPTWSGSWGWCSGC